VRILIGWSNRDSMRSFDSRPWGRGMRCGSRLGSPRGVRSSRCRVATAASTIRSGPSAAQTQRHCRRWDFCRAVDDAVDETPVMPSADVRLSLWRMSWRPAIRRSGRTGTTKDATCGPASIICPVAPAIRGSDRRRRMDKPRALRTLTRWRDTAAARGPAVGLVCVEIFGYEDSAARRG
jgi:hypothetical protein